MPADRLTWTDMPWLSVETLRSKSVRRTQTCACDPYYYGISAAIDATTLSIAGFIEVLLLFPQETRRVYAVNINAQLCTLAM